MRFPTWRRRREEELDEEIQAHLRMAIRDRMERGDTRENAGAAARREFGNVLQVKDVTRDTWGWTWLEQLLQDVRYGLRQMRRAPGFAAVAILTLALCIGANTAIFSVVHAVLLRPLPYPQPDRLAYLFGYALSNGNFEDWKQKTHSYERFAPVSVGGGPGLLQGTAEPENIIYCEASREFFDLLGVHAARGRTFAQSDFRPDSPGVMLISSRFWRAKLGSDPTVVGRTLTLDGRALQVIGVLPDRYPLPNPLRRKVMDVWLPLHDARDVEVVARLRPGITLAQAEKEADLIPVRIPTSHERPGGDHYVNVTAVGRFFGEDAHTVLWMLAGAVSLVLLIGCLNIANLSLARMSARRRELAVRGALGAGRARLVRQLLTESLLLSLLGGAIGVLLATWLVPLLVALSPYDVARIEDASIDGNALVFTLATALLTTLLFGLIPAWRSTRVNVQADLKEGGRESTGTRTDRRLRGALAVAEIAISLVLLIGAGLLIRTLLLTLPAESGFDPRGKLVMRIITNSGDARAQLSQTAFVRSALERLRAVAGPGGASFVSTLPNIGMTWIPYFWIDGQLVAEKDRPILTAMTEAYFGQLKMPMVAGRSFLTSDDEHAPRVAIVNQAMARRLWSGVDPIGRRIEVETKVGGGGQRAEVTVVGVVGDTRGYLTIHPERIELEIYLPWAQAEAPGMFLVVNAPGDPTRMAASVRRALRSVEPATSFADPETLDQVLDHQLRRPRFNASLLGCLAALAFILATIGIYGVISYSARQREHEIGLRMALGAPRSAVLRMILRQALAVIAVGVAAGLLAAGAFTRLLTSLLYRTKPLDPLTLAIATAALALVAATASAIPAWRAAKADPLVALRHE